MERRVRWTDLDLVSTLPAWLPVVCFLYLVSTFLFIARSLWACRVAKSDSLPLAEYFGLVVGWWRMNMEEYVLLLLAKICITVRNRSCARPHNIYLLHLCLYQVEHFQHKLQMKTSTAEFPIAAAPVQMEECISMHAQEIQLNNPRATVNSKYAQ